MPTFFFEKKNNNLAQDAEKRFREVAEAYEEPPMHGYGETTLLPKLDFRICFLSKQGLMYINFMGCTV